MNTNLKPTDLQKVRDTLMRLYDYIDGGIPCPYPTPQEWRKRLLSEAEGSVALLEGRTVRPLASTRKSDAPERPRRRKPRAGKIEKAGLRAAILRVKKRRD